MPLMDGELAPPVKEIMDDADGLYEDWMAFSIGRLY
jgi:hypothetical protein